MKKTLLLMAMVVALAMSTMAGAFAAGHTGITSPSDGETIVADILELRAYEPGADEDREAAWAVRSAENNPECGTSQPDLAGWKGGALDDDVTATWEDGYFAADINVSGWDRDAYCFAFNPANDAGEFGDFRDTVTFTLATADSKDACKDGGWMTFGDYKNQGECVRYFAANANASFDTYNG